MLGDTQRPPGHGPEQPALSSHQSVFTDKLLSQASLETIFFPSFWIGKEEFHINECNTTD